MAAAGYAAKNFDIEVVEISKDKADADVKAPAVYLDDKVIAEDKGLRDGLITPEELVEELKAAGVPERSKPKSSCRFADM